MKGTGNRERVNVVRCDLFSLNPSIMFIKRSNHYRRDDNKKGFFFHFLPQKKVVPFLNLKLSFKFWGSKGTPWIFFYSILCCNTYTSRLSFTFTPSLNIHLSLNKQCVQCSVIWQFLQGRIFISGIELEADLVCNLCKIKTERTIITLFHIKRENTFSFFAFFRFFLSKSMQLQK